MNPRPTRTLVGALARTDELLDTVLYRPAVVRAFRWLPRWWLCDLAKVSMRLDDLWDTGWWDDAGIAPGPPCAACGRRASIHVFTGPGHTEVEVCGWCRVQPPIRTQNELERQLAAAAAELVRWRWR
jgi:hypothetical protein